MAGARRASRRTLRTSRLTFVLAFVVFAGIAICLLRGDSGSGKLRRNIDPAGREATTFEKPSFKVDVDNAFSSRRNLDDRRTF
jgi:hypothetical protein